jgi:hypothetical protein
VKCALYHALSNAVGGVRIRYSIESEQKAWIFYYPPTMQTGAALYPEDYMLFQFRGWHVNNGQSLGNDRLVFVATHLAARGDAFDGGYFLDTGKSVPPSERLRVRLDESAPSPKARLLPEVDDDQWPETRRLKAMRNFWVAWAWDKLARSVEHFGDGALGAVRHGCGTTILSFLPYYFHALRSSGMWAASDYFRTVHENGGWNVTTNARDEAVTVVFDRDPLRDARGTLSDDSIAAIYQALTDAWARAAGELDAKITLTSSESLPSWSFTAPSSG